jgi:hypothetical protein
MALEPTAGGEVCGNAGAEQGKANTEGAHNPAHLYTVLEHEADGKSQHEDEHCGFGKERGAAVRGDGDEIEES